MSAGALDRAFNRIPQGPTAVSTATHPGALRALSAPNPSPVPYNLTHEPPAAPLMESHRIINRALLVVVASAGVGMAVLSLLTWDPTPIGFFAGCLVAMVAIAILYGVLFCPLMLLLGALFGRRNEPRPPSS